MAIKCKTCEWWKVIDEPDTIIEHPGYWTTDVPPVWVEPRTETIVNTGNHGECKRHPPQYAGMGNEPWRFPIIEKDEKCYEYVEET